VPDEIFFKKPFILLIISHIGNRGLSVNYREMKKSSINILFTIKKGVKK